MLAHDATCAAHGEPDLAGIAGVAFYLGSYFALQAGFIRGSGYLYAVLNLAASSLVLVSLFNSFNVLSDLVYEDQDLAVKFIRQMSDLYRYVLDSRE